MSVVPRTCAMSLNVTYHGLDVSYSADLCEVEQPQKRFKTVRRRSANFHRPRPKPELRHRNSELLNCTLSLSQVSEEFVCCSVVV